MICCNYRTPVGRYMDRTAYICTRCGKVYDRRELLESGRRIVLRRAKIPRKVEVVCK